MGGGGECQLRIKEEEARIDGERLRMMTRVGHLGKEEGRKEDWVERASNHSAAQSSLSETNGKPQSKEKWRYSSTRTVLSHWLEEPGENLAPE